MKLVWKYSMIMISVLMGCGYSLQAQYTPHTDQPPQVHARKPFQVGKIYVSGNIRTKDYIIKREMPFQEGDSIALTELVDKFRIGREQLVNTRLFNDVIISLKSFRGYQVDVQIDVKERWYIFPVPYLKPIDRNIQTWAQKGYSLQRLNLGAKFTHYNTTGRNDHLKLWLITGYSRQIQASYDQPFADKSLKSGYGFDFGYIAQKELNPLTLNNQQFFLKADSLPKAGRFLLESYDGAIQYTYRPGLKTRHLFRLGFNKVRVDSTVLGINPNYLSMNGKTSVSYPEFNYTLTYVNVDYAAYPQHGQMAEATLYRAGFGRDINTWALMVKGIKAWPLRWKSSFATQFNGILRLPFDQPYMQTKMFGYGDMYLRGLEKYVVDGVAGFMIRNTYRREIYNTVLRLPIKSQSHDHIPFRFYVKTYGDLGYSYSKNKLGDTGNTLSNRLLTTAGFGLDIVTLYDVVLRFEYSFNQLGQNGLFFHFKNEF